MKSLFINLMFFLIISVESDSKSNLINDIRKSVLQYFSLNPDLAYKSDIELVANKDWLIEVFIDSIYKSKDPSKSLIESLKAWKAVRILELNDTSFPSELFGLGFYYDFGVSKNGKPILGTIMPCTPPIGKVDPLIAEWTKKFIRYISRRILFKSEANNFYFYSNFDKPNILDTDKSTVEEIINTIILHFPRFAEKNILYKLNGIVVVILKALFKAMIPNYETVLKFLDTENELEQYISLDQVPVHNGGRNSNFVIIPDGVKSGRCLPQFSGITKDKWDYLKDIKIDCYLSSLKASGKSSLDEFLNEC